MAATAIRTVSANPGTVSRSDSRRPASVTEAYAHNAPRGTTPAATKGDRVELSDKGRLLGQAALFIKAFDATPDVRPEAVENARKTIESGDLFSIDAIRRAAKKLRRFVE